MTMTRQPRPAAETYRVHIRVGDLFEDVYVEARDEAEAEEKARAASTFTARQLRWARFVI